MLNSNEIEAAIKVTQIESYTENNCNIYPSHDQQLYRLDYWDATKLIPGYQRFGSMSSCDALDIAKNVAKKQFGSFFIRLSIPVLVIEVKI